MSWQSVNVLCEQYLDDLIKLFYKHAQFVYICLLNKLLVGYTYQLAKAIRHQLEQIWRKDKSAYNQARLCRQIARYNSMVNEDKANYFRNLVRENANDSKKLCQVLSSALQSSPETVLPSHESKKSLADRFTTFFRDRIAKITSSFSSSDSFIL